MYKRDLRTATQILTGHACLNYYFSKINCSVQPLCEAGYDTVPHMLAQFPVLWELSASTLTTLLKRIIGYVNRTSRVLRH